MEGGQGSPLGTGASSPVRSADLMATRRWQYGCQIVLSCCAFDLVRALVTVWHSLRSRTSSAHRADSYVYMLIAKCALQWLDCVHSEKEWCARCTTSPRCAGNTRTTPRLLTVPVMSSTTQQARKQSKQRCTFALATCVAWLALYRR